MEERLLRRRELVVGAGRGLVGASAIAALLEGCGGTSGSASSSSGTKGGGRPAQPTGTLTRSYEDEIDTLDPATVLSGGFPFIRSIYDGLAAYNTGFTQIVPSLAVDWSSSKDGREWTFKLRDGVHFQNGDPLTSRDVALTYAYTLAQKSFEASLVPPFTNVDTSDPTVIKFFLKTPVGDFLRNQTFLRIMPTSLIKRGPKVAAVAPIGTGPFRFVKHTPNVSATLAANDHYWGGGPYLKTLQWTLLVDQNARLNAYASGQLDQTNEISPNLLPEASSAPSSVIQQTSGWRMSYLRFFVTNPNVSDYRIRQAVAYAIDREEIIAKLLRGKADLATSVMPAGIYGQIDATPKYTYNPTRARALLKEAGSGPGHPIRVFVAPGQSVEGQDVTTAIVGYLKDAGFNPTLTVSTASVQTNEDSAAHPAHDLVYDETSWLTGGPVLFTIGLLQQLSRFNPPQLQALNAKQIATPDGPARLAALAEMQNIIQAQAPYIGLWAAYQIDATHSDIKGYPGPPPDGGSYNYAPVWRA